MNILKFDWKTFDAAAGAKYAVGVGIVIALATIADFSWYFAGLSALLAWLANVPGSLRARLAGVLGFTVVGAGLIALAHALAGTSWPWLIAMVVVAFLGTFAMIQGPRGFMVGWCLIILFFCAPLFGSANAPGDLLLAHLLGCAVFLVIIFATSPRTAREGSPKPERPSLRFVLGYSTAVALVMGLGLILGAVWLETDATLILNASLMVLLPSARQTWTVCVDRLIGALSGIVCGMALGLYLDGPVFEIALWIVSSFLVVSLLTVNAGAVIFFFILAIARGWGAIGGEAGNALANERIFGEVVGVLLAAIAVWVWIKLDRDAEVS